MAEIPRFGSRLGVRGFHEFLDECVGFPVVADEDFLHLARRVDHYGAEVVVEHRFLRVAREREAEALGEVVDLDQRAADGKTKEFYQVGISANTTGISVYIMGIQDKKYLPETYGKIIGKASVTGYCIKFKTLEDINIEILETAIIDGVKQTS